MSFTKTALLGALVTLACAGCSSRPTIRLDRMPGLSSSQYQTFAFASEHTAPERYVTLLEGEIKSSARAELERRNYVYSDRNPDLLVDVDLGSQLSIDVRDVRWNRSVWQGTAEGQTLMQTIERQFPTRVDEMVGTLFAGFPINRTGGDLRSANN